MTNKEFAIAVTKFFYFAMNFPYGNIAVETETTMEYLPTFLDAEWTCSKRHIVGKWLEASIKKYDADGYPIYNDSYGTINRFFAELDGENRMALLKWVNENYKYDEEKPFGITIKE